MFIGRNKELNQLKEQFIKNGKQAVMLYGTRRVGKSTLILESVKDSTSKVLYIECLLTSLERNVKRFEQKIQELFNNKFLHFADFEAAFEYLGSLDEDIIVIIDEYQYLKQVSDGRYVDSMFQNIIDQMRGNIKLVLLGSYVGMMKELLEKENPLFGRFSLIMHVKPFDYYDSAAFYPKRSVREKIELYSVFGGMPFSNALLDVEKNLANNICSLILSSSSPIRIYIENVLLAEFSKVANANMILSALANGKKRYSEIEGAIGAKTNGTLDKQLKNLLEMEIIRKVYPINKAGDKKKTFYEISDNLIRFYYSFVYGNADVISRIGADSFYSSYIATSIKTFIAHRFEEVCREYFMRQTRKGFMDDVMDIGTFWYNMPKEHKSGEFDCVIKHKKGYSFYEVKYHDNPLGKNDMAKELQQLKVIPENIEIKNIGFVTLSGYEYSDDRYILLSADKLYE
ncbi:ATP-binding protein [Anaerovibrio sp. RM50]|uniref:ATP-binding protein n=1 Tax=Anaerovibrio sp. RM50 TaxID=1200557 RepID=UPI000481C62C|nr:ATP-binding protein [Anaerovibrio sp. RM50]